MMPASLLCENTVPVLQGDLKGQKSHLRIYELLCSPLRRTSKIEKFLMSYLLGQRKFIKYLEPKSVYSKLHSCVIWAKQAEKLASLWIEISLQKTMGLG